MQKSTNDPKNKRADILEDLSEKFAEAIGSPTSLVIHSVFFVGIFGLLFFGIDLENILLILTTIVSLEAIYLALFIQMTVNKNAEDIEDIQEDVEDIQKEVEEIGDDVEDMEEDDDRNYANTEKKLQEIELALHSLNEAIASLRKKK
jgi:low affinity Fe/Cu permease